MTIERDAIRHLLSAGRAARDGVLIVHSGIRGLSRAGWQAEAICSALLDEMAGGSVLMPTMTWRTVTPSNPIFDEMTTPSHTGVLTEVFRTKFATHRSLHPTHSVAGYGPAAAALLSTHHHGTTPCPATSPYGLMRDWDTHILLLGVGMESCTAIHHAEEIVAPELYVRPMEEAEDYKLVDRHSVSHPVATRRHRKLPRDFAKFVPLLRTAGCLVEGQLPDTPWMMFPAGRLLRLAFAALVRDSDAILAGVGISPEGDAGTFPS